MYKAPHMTQYSELLVVLNGSATREYASILTEAEEAMGSDEKAALLLPKIKDMAADATLAGPGGIYKGAIAYGCKQRGPDDRVHEFVRLARDNNGFALSFCYTLDILVLERFFEKED